MKRSMQENIHVIPPSNKTCKNLSKNLSAAAVLTLAAVTASSCPFPVSVFAVSDEVSVDFSREPLIEEQESVFEDGISVSGIDISGDTRAEAEAALNGKYETLSAQEIQVMVDGTEIPATWKTFGLYWECSDILDQAMLLGKGSGHIGKYKALTDMEAEGSDFTIPCGIDNQKIDSFVENELTPLNCEAQNAILSHEDGVFTVTAQVNGRTVNIEATEQAIEDAIQANNYEGGFTVDAVVDVQQPAVTTEALSAIQDVLGSYTTDVSGSENRKSNVRLGASNISGKLLLPGESASASEMMQKRTRDNGYKKAPQYANGQSVDAVGGGICQVSSTLYNALLGAELQIDERHPHSMTVSYLPHSKDAAISDGYKDLKFTNNQEYPIYIESEYRNSQLTFRIYGKEVRPESRKVEYKSTTVYSNYPADIVKYDPNQPTTYKSSTGSRHPSVKSYLEKIVYEDGVEVSREKLHTDEYSGSARTVTYGSKAPDPVTVPEETIPETPAAEETPEEAPVE